MFNPTVISRFGAIYCKIAMQGQGTLPDALQVVEFNRTVGSFMRNNRNQLIGVHCTHGVNRTGFMICQYMVNHLRMSASSAVHSFQEARGHEIERKSYVDALYRMDVSSYRNNYNNRYSRNNTLNALVQQERAYPRAITTRTRPSRWSS
ncbi:RNA/RNP complex-1-interacting phosphatase isoform X2 [Tetranychus urticae]|uniref:RNA/RNP complex-1-interacting phosphatase isoform X2 n=1 Tax=Tetranychus urticae TaxID=32264 RepID=UPI000D6558D6|nr:RNA/RNP complex-1-interacting phosphatase isoform X2 [Tetranychus urticae]